MNSVEDAWGQMDIRGLIFEQRTKMMIPELTKKIYPKWKYNSKMNEYYVVGKPGPNSEPGTSSVRWSLSPVNYGQVDFGRLLITDRVHDIKKKNITRFDGLVDTSLLDIKNESWYITDQELEELARQNRIEELDDYLYDREMFFELEKVFRMNKMDKEMIRRNESAELILYKIPSYENDT